MRSFTDDTLLYRYRLSLTGHHSIIVLSDFKDIDALDDYLQDNVEGHKEKFICMDARMNLSDLKVRVSDICVIERPWGEIPVKLGDIRKKTSSLNAAATTVTASVGQKAKKR